MSVGKAMMETESNLGYYGTWSVTHSHRLVNKETNRQLISSRYLLQIHLVMCSRWPRYWEDTRNMQLPKPSETPSFCLLEAFFKNRCLANFRSGFAVSTPLPPPPVSTCFSTDRRPHWYKCRSCLSPVVFLAVLFSFFSSDVFLGLASFGFVGRSWGPLNL